VADFVLLLFIAGFVRGGWSTGFLRRLIGLGYIAISLVAGAYLRQPVGALVNQFFPKIPPSYAEMLGYSIAFGVLVAVLNLVSHQVLGKVAVQGVSRGLDKVLGAVFGGVEAILLISAAIVILDTYFGTFGALFTEPGLGFLKTVDQELDSSTIGQFLIHTTVPFVLAILGPLLPQDVSSVVPTGLPGLPGLPGSGAPGLPGFPFPSPTK
jgi:uncharacterized membrane protein required for colicin V production